MTKKTFIALADSIREHNRIRGDPMAYTKASLKRLRAIIREGKSVVARIERKQTSKAERRRILAKPENWQRR
jgi:hypothetical protein